VKFMDSKLPKQAGETDMRFEVGKFYKSSGRYLAIVGVASTTCFGDCLIGEDTEGRLSPIGRETINASGYSEIDHTEWLAQFPQQ